jgi:hypothetical protein
VVRAERNRERQVSPSARKLIFDESFGSFHETGEHTHAIDEQTAISGMMDVGLHAGPIQAQFAPCGHFCLPG